MLEPGSVLNASTAAAHNVELVQFVTRLLLLLLLLRLLLLWLLLLLLIGIHVGT